MTNTQHFLNQYEKSLEFKQSQKLQTAEIFDLPLNEAQILKQNLTVFEKIGLIIKPAGKKFKITKAPKILLDRNLPQVISETLHDLAKDESSTLTPTQAQSQKKPKADHKIKHALSYLACRSAIKAGEKLSPKQQQQLINQLNKCQIEYTCPHGRPSKVDFNINEVHKMFKRT